MLNGRPRRRGDAPPPRQNGGAFMAQLRDHVRKCGPLLGSRSDDFLKQLPDDVHHPRPLKRHIQQNAASYGLRFEDRQPPDGWVVELTGDVQVQPRGAQSDERTILTALAAWILSRSERRMRSGEIDQFYSQHKSLPRKKGVSWLNDDLLEMYGLRRALPKDGKSFFYIEQIPRVRTTKPLNSPWASIVASARPEETPLGLEDPVFEPLGSDPVFEPSQHRSIGAIGVPSRDLEREAREAYLVEEASRRRLREQHDARERDLLVRREREESERRLRMAAQSEEASLALARKLMAEDAAALGQRAEPAFQSVSSSPPQCL